MSPKRVLNLPMDNIGESPDPAGQTANKTFFTRQLSGWKICRKQFIFMAYKYSCIVTIFIPPCSKASQSVFGFILSFLPFHKNQTKNFLHFPHIFVAAKHVFCRDKIMLLATNIFDKYFFSRQEKSDKSNTCGSPRE